jgi:hypothetical protein
MSTATLEHPATSHRVIRRVVTPAATAAAQPLPATAASSPVTKLSLIDWTGHGEGEKTMAYSKSGEGKTTLGSLAPNAIFLPLDDGGRKIINPLTGKAIRAVDPSKVRDYDTARFALQQTDLYPPGCTLVLDTITKLEEWAQNKIAASCKKSSFKDVGWNGSGYLQDAMRAILADLEVLIRKGVNVVLLAQQSEIAIANADGVDYLESGPKLLHQKGISIRTDLIEWCDHVVKIGRSGVIITKDEETHHFGKVRNEVGSDALKRVIFTDGPLHFIAKSRPNPVTHKRLPPIVSFDDQTDDSFWNLLFNKGE